MLKATWKRIALYSFATPVAIILGFVTLESSASDDADRQRAMAVTVQVTAIVSPPDYSAPWQCKRMETFTGSGVVIEGNRVLTNAHVVANAASIELRRMGLPDQYLARVEYIDHGSDLALLTVDKLDFFADVEALPIGGMPEMEASVTVYGYPLNAQTVCATEGVVSRVEYSTYAHNFRDLLMAQLDAPINPGSSGGPAFVDGRLVGLAMQKPDDTEGAGQCIPAPIITRFLTDVADGRVDGVPSLGVGFQNLDSEAMRQSLGMAAKQSGIYVYEVGATGSCGGRLHVGDVILAIDGLPVANDGTIPLDDSRRIAMSWAVNRKQVGDRVNLTLLRGGQALRVSVDLTTKGDLVAGPIYPARAPYRIFGGLVFQPIDYDLAISQQPSLPTNSLLLIQRGDVQTETRRECVTLGRILPHPVNRGFQDWGTEIVESVQGVPVRDFAHFNDLLDSATGRWISITCDDATTIVLDLTAARASLREVLARFSITDERYPPTPGRAGGATS